MKNFILFVCVFFCAFSYSKKETASFVLKEYSENKPPFKVIVLTKDLNVPWGMVFINREELLSTEKEGNLKILHTATGKIKSVTGLPKVFDGGQGGLLDVALHPEFQKNKIIYWTFSRREKNKYTTSLAKAELQNNKLNHVQILFSAKPFAPAQRHFGSRIVFDKKGFLFFTVGDRGQKKEAQNLNSHFGKLLRIRDDGSIPSDNPFVGNKEALPEIYSYGHRNPQGLFIHKDTGEIWLQEHGPKGGDEINLIEKGGNYGWPVITHGKSYAGFKIGKGVAMKGMKQPIKYWVPSIAPSGLLIYSGDRFPQWKGNIFSGALKLTHLNRLKIKNRKILEEERLLSDLNLRVRHVIQGPEGFIYISADRGWILRLQPLNNPLP